MRFVAPLFAAFLLLASTAASHAQDPPRHFDLEVEPLAYVFGGAGGHAAYQRGKWKYEVEAFALEVPETLHGNDGFGASLLGAELHFEHYFGEDSGGFYLGPEVGVVQLDVSHQPSGTSTQKTRYSVGVRGGYQWYPGLGNLYISPVVGLSYTLNGSPVTLGGVTFETTPLSPWGTVGFGWSFGR